MRRPLALAVFLSGAGTTFDALAEAIAGGHLPGRIALVLADRPHAPGVELARRHGLPTAVRPLHGVPPAAWVDDVDALLRAAGVELVVLAGFLAILPPGFVARWRGRIINVHPALLPRHGGAGMYGLRVHRAVLDAGEAASGATVHLVSDAIDEGPTLLQEEVAVLRDDTPEILRERIRPVERRLLMEAIRKFASGEWPLPYPASDVPPQPTSRSDGPP